MSIFVNPYNFVPLYDKCAYITKEKGTYTGVIDYSVLTKTPLFIPNTSNDNALCSDVKDHKTYEFFAYKDLSDCKEAMKEPDYMPVIPGSEIRGMLRSYFEILTNSCMSAVDDTVTLSKRTYETYKAGLIKKTGAGTYDLYGAVDCLMRTKGENSLEDDWEADNAHYKIKCYVQKDLKEGQRVYFQYVERTGQRNGKPFKCKPLAKCVSTEEFEAPDRRTGYVIKGEDGPQTNSKQQKHCCHIFTEDGLHTKGISLSTLKQVIKAYKDNGKHPYKEYAQQLHEFEKNGAVGEFFPVYYSKVKAHLMLSPACITREIYGRTLREMIGTYASCTNENELCPACTLFGTIGSGFSRASRIRVADLVCAEPEGKECFEQPVTLAPLSSPKLNNMEFYLKRPKDAWFWTYDYYIDDKGNLYENNEGINGRKFYWHQLDMKLENQEPTNLNMTIRPLKKDITFKGRLYFRNLTKQELDQLIYLLSVGDEDVNDEENKLRKKTHGYKLGGGKPLGLGSIAVSVDKVMIRRYKKHADNHIVERKESPYDEYSEPKFKKEILDNFKIMTDFNAVKNKNISYPLTEDGNMNIYEWFTQNHKSYKKKGNINERIDMPNSRKQMVYAEYMVPMKAELVSTGFMENSVEPNSGQQNNGQRRAVPSNGKKAIDAEVIRRDSYGIYIKEIADPSKKGRIGTDYLKGQNPKEGDTIKVSFYKTNAKGMNIYNIIV